MTSKTVRSPTRDGFLLLASAALLAAACGEPAPATVGRFGEVTSAIVLVNPVINQGSTTTVATGSQRADLEVRAGELDPVRTDSTGLVLIEELPTGSVPFQIESESVPVSIVQPRELYDMVLAWREGSLAHVIPPVRYPVAGDVQVLAPGSDIAAAASDNAILLLEPGAYPGNFELRADGVLIFGAWSVEEGPLSTIEGDVTVLGGSNRIRGAKITGTLTSNANGFSAAFSDIGAAKITGNDVSLLRNRFTAGRAEVPSSSAVLVDNQGIP